MTMKVKAGRKNNESQCRGGWIRKVMAGRRGRIMKGNFNIKNIFNVYNVQLIVLN